MRRYSDRTNEFHDFLSYENEKMSSPIAQPKSLPAQTSVTQSRFYISSHGLTRDLLRTNERLKKLQEAITKDEPFEEAKQRRKALSVRVGKDIKSLRLRVTGLRQEVEDYFRAENNPNRSKFPTDQERHQKQVCHLSQTMVEYLEKKNQWIMNEQRLKQRRKEKRRNPYFNRKRKTFNTSSNLLRPVQSHDDVLLMAEPPSSGRPDRRKALSDGRAYSQGEEENGGEEEFEFDFNEQKLEQKKYRLERSKEVQKVNEKLDQIQQMFMEFGKMVVAQRDLAMRIDDQVTDAEVHTGMAQKELTKYHNTISSNRGLILKIFAILVLLVVFVGLFIIK